MDLKDDKEGVFLKILNQLDELGKGLKPIIKGYVLIAIQALEMILIYGYGRTREEISYLRQEV